MELDSNHLPILTQYGEEGFIDCVFKIDGLKSDGSYYYFNLLASHEEKRVGFAIKLIKEIGPGFDSDMHLIKENVYRQGVSFRSLREISDRLVNALAGLYGFNRAGLKMVSEETFTAIALQIENTLLEEGEVKLKLFGKDGDDFVEDDYYECFLNVDIPNGFVFWNEKDPDYRESLIKGICQA